MMSREQYEPAMLKANEEAKAIAAGVEPIMIHARSEDAEWQPSRADLHALVDACCDLAEVSKRSGFLSSVLRGYDPPARIARDIGQALASGALGWTEPPGPVGVKLTEGSAAVEAWKRVSQRNPALWRMEIIERLQRAPNVLPAFMIRQLTATLRLLNDGTGESPSLLMPVPKEGRGRNPRLARQLEERMWEWIYYQHGAGRRLSDAIADVAEAVSRSPQAINAWRDAWRDRDKASHPFNPNPMSGRIKAFTEGGTEDLGRPEIPKFEADQMRQLAEEWLVATTPVKAET